MRKDQKIYVMRVEKTHTGFSAFSKDFAVFTTGRTLPEVLTNAIEALNLYFEDPEVRIGRENIRLEIDFKQFFQYFKVLNSKFLAEKIGMNPSLLSQYVHGHKKPSDKQTQKILSGIRAIGGELAGLQFTDS